MPMPWTCDQSAIYLSEKIIIVFFIVFFNNQILYLNNLSHYEVQARAESPSFLTDLSLIRPEHFLQEKQWRRQGSGDQESQQVSPLEYEPSLSDAEGEIRIMLYQILGEIALKSPKWLNWMNVKNVIQ